MRPIPDHIQNFLSEIAPKLTDARFDNDDVVWSHLYQELKSFYEEQKSMGRLHPALVESLADYTENDQDALNYYQEALKMCLPDEPHYMILISMSRALERLGQKESAKRSAFHGLNEALEKEDYYYIREAEEVLRSLSQ